MALNNLPLFDLADKRAKSPQEAKALGLPRYFTGKPCIHGHISPRTASSRGCVTCKYAVAARWRVNRCPEKRRAKEHQRWLSTKEHMVNEKRKYRRRLDKRKPWARLLLGARKRCAQRGLDYTLSDTWAAARWTGRCEVTGIPFDPSRRVAGGRGFAPSLDRIDNAGGYTQDNCRFVLFAVNTFKGTMTDRQMIRIAEAIIKYASASELLPPPA